MRTIVAYCIKSFLFFFYSWDLFHGHVTPFQREANRKRKEESSRAGRMVGSWSVGQTGK